MALWMSVVTLYENLMRSGLSGLSDQVNSARFCHTHTKFRWIMQFNNPSFPISSRSKTATLFILCCAIHEITITPTPFMRKCERKQKCMTSDAASHSSGISDMQIVLLNFHCIFWLIKYSPGLPTVWMFNWMLVAACVRYDDRMNVKSLTNISSVRCVWAAGPCGFSNVINLLLVRNTPVHRSCTTVRVVYRNCVVLNTLNVI